MCMQCSIQKWVHFLVAMLPWLIVPLVGVWAVSQCLPLEYRIELTSTHFASVLVLIGVSSWYELFLPRLSGWKEKRDVFLKEMERLKMVEKVKLRKMATKRCRNCWTSYREQNPCGGKYMCTHCGQTSKKPLLDVPVGIELSKSVVVKYGVIEELVSKVGNDWVSSDSIDRLKDRGRGNFGRRKAKLDNRGRNAHCLIEKSFWWLFDFALKLLNSFVLCIRLIWRKTLIKEVSSDEDGNRRLSSKVKDTFHESRAEKARRKAEEKRQARLEKELWEEEERKQREEISKLVEEQRRLKDEISKSEKVYALTEDVSPCEQKKNNNKRRREKEKGSSKSNSDVEDPEKRSGLPNNGCGKKHGFDNVEKKVSTPNYFSRESTTKYLNRMKGTFIASSKSLSGSCFLGKGPQTSVNAVSRKNNTSVSASYIQVPSFPAKPILSATDTVNKISFNKLVHPQLRAWETPKRQWTQLFSQSSTSSLVSSGSTLSKSNQKCQPPVEIPESSTYPFITFTNAGQGSPSTSSPYSPIRKPTSDFLSEETDLFEDALNVPDQVALPAPVSESLFSSPINLRSICASTEANHPSPVVSPLSIPAWRMWDTPQLGPEGLGLLSKPASCPSVGHDKFKQDCFSPAKQNKHLDPRSNENCLWLQRSPHGPISSEAADLPNGSTTACPFDLSSNQYKDYPGLYGSVKVVCNPLARPYHVGDQYPSRDVY